MLRSGLLAILVLIGAADDEPRPQNRGPEPSADQVLKSKGLKRIGPVYVLEAEAAVGQLGEALARSVREIDGLLAQMVVMEQEIARRQAMQFGLESQRQALAATSAGPAPSAPPTHSGGSGHSAPANAGGEQIDRLVQGYNVATEIVQLQGEIFQLRVAENQLGSLVAAKQAELRRRQSGYEGLALGVARRYVELRGDPEVKRALAEINRTANPTVALGPADDYQANVRRMAADILRQKGVISTRKGAGVTLGVDADAKSLAYLTGSFQRELGVALGERQALARAAEFRARQRVDLERELERLEAEPGGEDVPARPKDRRREIRERLERLRAEAADAEARRRELNLHVSARREAFLKSVAALRKALDESRKKHAALGEDPDLRRSVEDLGVRLKKGAMLRAPASGAHLAVLEQAERLIRTETVPLDPDKVLFWVDVALNDGKTAIKMMLDPTEELVRLPASIAASLGLEAAPGEPTVSVTLADGRALAARRATLARVRIGTFSVDEVECVVLPEGCDQPPVLGASVLDRFASKLDPDSATLTLTRVDVKPLTGRPKARR